MNNINYIYIIPAIATLAIAAYTFITTKNTAKTRKYKYLILCLVSLIVVSSIFINNYYDRLFIKQNKDIGELISINNKKLFDSNKSIDSLDINDLELIKNRTQKLLDSIKKQNELLLKYKNDIEKIENVIGNKDQTKKDINNKVSINKQEIDEIIHYNKRIDNTILQKRKGSTYSGNSDKFIFECPHDFESDILDISLVFVDERIVEEVAYISISFAEKKTDKNYLQLSEDLFEAQKGKNSFKVKNFFKNNLNKKIELQVGYTLKSESKKEYPRFEKIICRNF